RGDVAGHVYGEVGDVDRRPAGVDDVDEHQGIVVWEVNEDVVRRVIRAVPGQLDAFATDSQRAAVPEGLLSHRPRRAVVPQQEPARLLVPNADDVLVEQR